MIKEIAYKKIFELFLKSLHVNSTIVETLKGYRTESKSKDFRLVKKENSIVFHQYSIVLDGGAYLMNQDKCFLYLIKEDMGNIIVYDENKSRVMTLTDTHSILRIEKDVFKTKPAKSYKKPAAIKTEEPSVDESLRTRTQLEFF